MPDRRKRGYLSDKVHQATRMVSAQADCEMSEGLNRLRIRARAMGQSVEATALDVFDGLIRQVARANDEFVVRLRVRPDRLLTTPDPLSLVCWFSLPIALRPVYKRVGGT